MTNYEFLKQNREAFQQAIELGISVADVQYLDLYETYQRLLAEGHKKMYIQAYLCEQYGVTERTIQRIVARMG